MKQFEKFSLYEPCQMSWSNTTNGEAHPMVHKNTTTVPSSFNYTVKYGTTQLPDSYEQLTLDLMTFISKTYMPARGQHKNQLVKFMNRYIRLKGWGFDID